MQHYWAEEKKALVKERNAAKTKEERDELTARLEYMNRVEMAVVISEEADEDEKFKAQGLDISFHRNKLNEITPEGKDIEDRFKDKDDSLRLVFVCAMWLTGLDVPSLSTLYLDKPMKGHTLMQAIARANRVFPGKSCGIVVDYVNVFKYMQQALSDYASNGDDGTDFPAKDITLLMANIDSCIEACDLFLQDLGIRLDKIIANDDTLDKLENLRQAYDKILEKDESKIRFKVMSNLVMNLHDAAKPEIFELGWKNEKFSPLSYLNGLFCNRIDDEKLRRAKEKMTYTLDDSVTVMVEEDMPQYRIHQSKVIDLSKLDIERIRKAINTAPYKAMEIENLRRFIETALKQLIKKNRTRVPFSQRYKNIIDTYNAGGTENEDYYEKLLQLIDELKTEQGRSTDMGLKEEELEIYDLLVQGRKLTKNEEKAVILASKNLYNKLMEEKENLLIVDWYKDPQPKTRVLGLIQRSLDKDLPNTYDKEVFSNKTNLLLDHFVDMAVQGYGWIA